MDSNESFVPRRTKIDRRVQRRREDRQWKREYQL